MTLPVGQNHLTISRTANGQVMVQAQNMQNRDVGFVGAVTGDATFIIGTTDSGIGTQYNVIGNNSTIKMNDASQNTAFWGTGLNVDITDNNHEANIQWNANYSSLSAVNTSRGITLETTENANNNTFTFGWGDASILDGGDYNITQLGSGTSYYASMSGSKGAVVLGGAGKAIYDIAGSYGVFQQGTGDAVYTIADLDDEYNNASGYMNAIISDTLASGYTPNANITDHGTKSLIIAHGAGSKVGMDGYKSLASVNGSALITIHDKANKNLIWDMTKHDGDENGAGLASQLSAQKWCNYVKGVSNNFYMNNSGHGSNITSSLASNILSNWLTLGDNYGKTH